MRSLIIILSFFISGNLLAFDGKEVMRISSYVILSNETEKELVKEKKSKFTFRINEYASSQTKKVRYSVDDQDEKSMVTSNETEIVEYVKAGEHDFKFLLNLNHYEIIIGDLTIEEGHHMIVQLNFRRSDQNIQLKKPVIYLYPEEETEIHLEVEAEGELTFMYPKYENGWDVTADSLGNITANGENFNYLFWEGEQEFNTSQLSYEEGFYVQGSNITSFLESSLNQFGFTSKEKADFITYWAPQMKDATNLYIYFLFNESCDQFATLNISPEPAQIARFYMLWANAGSDYDDIGLIPQDIPTINREGFTVLEWGGAEVSTESKTIN